MSDEGEHGEHHGIDHGVPALRELRPSTRMFLWITAISMPIVIAALYLITNPLQGGMVGSNPDTQFWMYGLVLLMVPAGLIMSAAVYQSASGHDDGEH